MLEGGTAASVDRPDRLRILVTSWRDEGHPEAGGAEVFLERVTSSLAERGHHVTIGTARYPGSLPSQARGDRLFVRAGGRYTVYPRGLLHAAVHRRQYDVILDIANGVPFWTPVALAAPVVCLVHHVHREQWAEVFSPAVSRFGWWMESKVTPAIYRRAQFLAVSNATAADLQGLGVSPERIRVIYSGVETAVPQKRLMEAPPFPHLVCIGRLVPHKRIEIALRTVARMREHFPGVLLTIAGSGYWEEGLRAEAARLGIEDHVRFAGVISDQEKANLLAEATIHLMPSLKEGWGLVIIEAATVATPSIAFGSAGGTKESVVQNETGILVETEDEFYEAVLCLSSDSAERERLGAQALRHSQRFNWGNTADGVEDALMRAAGKF